MYACATYIHINRLVSLSLSLLSQIEIEKEEEKKKKLFCLQNQFKFSKKREERNRDFLSCDGSRNCGFFLGSHSSLHDFFIMIVLKRKVKYFFFLEKRLRGRKILTHGELDDDEKFFFVCRSGASKLIFLTFFYCRLIFL